MKKLLMITTAIAGVAMLSAPASAAIDLSLGGYFRGYAVDTDNDLTNRREQEFRRAVELWVDGETTLDNGLTVGTHMEIGVAPGATATDNSLNVDEVYAYASGGWGRVQLGDEDGAAYLLQVTAPSADSNVDGFDVTINGLDVTTGVGMNGLAIVGSKAFVNNDAVEYAQQDFENVDRLTYMTPKYNGFQAGVSYAFSNEIATNVGSMSDADNTAGEYEDIIDVAVRYDGEYQGFAFGVGAGYSTADLSADDTPAALAVVGTAGYVLAQTEGVDTYNVGANVMFQNFSLGGSYKLSSSELTADTVVGATGLVSSDIEAETYVIGGAYDNGPYHVGVSYLDQTYTRDAINAAADLAATDTSYAGAEKEIDRLTIGGGYSFGPGITFRGSIGWGTVETKSVAAATLTNGTNVTALTGDTAAKRDFTQIAVGTDIKF